MGSPVKEVSASPPRGFSQFDIDIKTSFSEPLPGDPARDPSRDPGADFGVEQGFPEPLGIPRGIPSGFEG